MQNSATKGIQEMQVVSNLPISAWLTAAARRGFPIGNPGSLRVPHGKI